MTGALSDAQLTLFREAASIATNDNWYEAPNAIAIATAANQVGALALASASRDAAILISLSSGSYTAQVSGVGGVSGNALVEACEVPCAVALFGARLILQFIAAR